MQEKINEIVAKDAAILHKYSVKDYCDKNKFLSICVTDFQKRVEYSADKSSFLQSEIEANTINLNDPRFSFDPIDDLEKMEILGYSDAVNGINKLFVEIISNVKKQDKGFDTKTSYGVKNLQLNYSYYLTGYIKAFYVSYLESIELQKENKNLDENLAISTNSNIVQKMAWLNELGILNLIAERCKNENVINYTKAGKLIASFTDIEADTARKCMDALFNPYTTNPNNNPTKNPENRLYVSDLLKKYRLESIDKKG